MEVYYKIDHEKIDEDLINLPVDVYLDSSNMLASDFDKLFSETRSSLVSGTKRYVGSGQPYSTIQAALDASNHGDEVCVMPGTYDVDLNIVTFRKRVHLVGMGTAPTDVLIHTRTDGIWQTLGFDGLSDSANGTLIIENVSIRANATWGYIFWSNNITATDLTVLFYGCRIYATGDTSSMCNGLNGDLNIRYTNCDISNFGNHVHQINNGSVGFSKCLFDRAYNSYNSSVTPSPLDWVQVATPGYGKAYREFPYGGPKPTFNVRAFDGTLCYTEVVWYNNDDREMYFCTKIPLIHSDNYTYFNFVVGGEYNSDYTGFVGSVPGNNVWSGYATNVWHLQQDGITEGSVNNSIGTIVGTLEGSMGSSDLVPFGYGKALDFDAIDDGITLVPSITFSQGNAFSWTGSTNTTVAQHVICHSSAASGRIGIMNTSVTTQYDSSNYWTNTHDLNLGTTITGIHNYTLVRHPSSGEMSLYVDGEHKSTVAGTTNDINLHSVAKKLFTSAWENYGGKMKEIYHMDTAPSPAEIKARSNSTLGTLVTRVYPIDCEGVTSDLSNNPLSNVLVRLYRRSDGIMIDEVRSDIDGKFKIHSLYVEDHYAIAFRDDSNDESNALIFDYLTPTISGVGE